MPNVAELIRDHVTLTVDCVDRLYLNAYVPRLQTSGGVVRFLGRGDHVVPSPALFGQITQAFKTKLLAWCEAEKVRFIEFRKGERKDDVVQPYRCHFPKSEGVVLVGVAQEKASSWTATKETQGPRVHFDFHRRTVSVNHYYFYFIDPEWGPGFIKVCSYAPYAIKLCLNAHEWAKRQASKRGLGWKALDNGFLTCDDPAGLQTVCDSLTDKDIEACFERWLSRVPLPLSAADAEDGFGYHLSILQMEVSRTQVFDRPLRGREFFEEVIRDNLDLGRWTRLTRVRVSWAQEGRPTRRQCC